MRIGTPQPWLNDCHVIELLAMTPLGKLRPFLSFLGSQKQSSEEAISRFTAYVLPTLRRSCRTLLAKYERLVAWLLRTGDSSRRPQ